MQTHFEADRHNFGRAVEIQERASGIWFQKPRSVFWEHLFFGVDSPLRRVFDTVGPNGTEPLSKYLFNLKVEQESLWSGAAKEVCNVDVEPTSEHFYGFGVLLAYAYLFGIRDLHRYNLVMTETHLQAVDAEVVLTDLVLPHETILLPFKDISFELSGISRLVSSLDALAERECERLFSGFIDLLSVAFCKQDELIATMSAIDNQHPIRVIVRNTGPYRAHLRGEMKIEDLILEERIQTERGDVPYFFKRSGEDALYWIESPDLRAAAVSTLGLFEKDVKRHAVAPANLIAFPNRIQQRLVHGLLFLQRKIAAPAAQYSFATRAIQLQGSRLVFSNPSEIYSSESQR